MDAPVEATLETLAVHADAEASLNGLLRDASGAHHVSCETRGCVVLRNANSRSRMKDGEEANFRGSRAERYGTELVVVKILWEHKRAYHSRS